MKNENLLLSWKMVNTFILCSDFSESASLLDDKRLFKQCVEARQIISILEESNLSKKGFSNHPATKQWIGYLDGLKYYFNCHLDEVFRRGRWNVKVMKIYPIPQTFDLPWFVISKPFHFSHRASLFRKNPEYYKDLTFPAEYLNHGYIWPSHLDSIDVWNLEQYPLERICDPVQIGVTGKTCPCQIQTGKRKGERCGNTVKSGDYCGVHSKLSRSS